MRFLNKKAVLLIAAVIAFAAVGYFAYPALARDYNVDVEVNNQNVVFPDQKPFVEKITSLLMSIKNQATCWSEIRPPG